MKSKIVAVIGASAAKEKDIENAVEVGRLIAKEGWTLICGGLDGVMEAASSGAAHEGGTVVGILPQADRSFANPHVTIPIATNMGHARNAIIAHSADSLIAIGGGYGTLSEMAIALRLKKPVFILGSWEIEGIKKVKTPKEAVDECKKIMG